MTPAKSYFGLVLQLRFKPDINYCIIPTACFFPDLSSLQAGHNKFVAPDSIHFFTDNLLDVLYNAHAKRQISIYTSHFLIDKAGLNEQLGVLGNFICWC